MELYNQSTASLTMPVVVLLLCWEMCSQKRHFEFKFESGIVVYQVKKESKGKQGTENSVTNLEGSGAWGAGLSVGSSERGGEKGEIVRRQARRESPTML